jgi:hypothetical protein
MLNSYPFGIQVITAVIVVISFFWDVTLRSLIFYWQIFGGSSCIHIQGRRSRYEKELVLILL